jgi:hypothetical protein
MGFEPMISTVTGWHPLRTGPTSRVILTCFIIVAEGFEPPTQGLKTQMLSLALPTELHYHHPHGILY